MLLSVNWYDRAIQDINFIIPEAVNTTKKKITKTDKHICEICGGYILWVFNKNAV